MPHESRQLLECGETTSKKSLPEQIQQCLTCFYGQVSPIVYHQVHSVVRRHYNGNLRAYVRNFLQPATVLLRKLQKVPNHAVACQCKADTWPLSQNRKVIVHLTEFPKSCLHRGDFYLCVTRTNFGQVQLSVKYLAGGGIRELLVLESDYSTLFTMDWIEKMRVTSDRELGLLLKRCVVAVENGIQRMHWDDVATQSRPGDLCRKQNSQKLDIVFDFTGLSQRLESPGVEGVDEGEVQSRQRYQALLSSRPKLDLPKTVMDVDYSLLHSGVAILPGCKDVDGRMVVYMFTSSSLWTNQQVASTELARLVMYYCTIPREEVRQRGLTIVGDIRGATTSTVNTMLEALYLFEANIPTALSSVHLLADGVTRDLVLRSPVYDSQSRFKVNLHLSQDHLLKFIDASQTPAALDGSYSYSHEDWVRFHMKFEPFMATCRSVGQYLVEVMHELVKVDSMPCTVKETSQLISQHENFIKATFDHPQLVSLQNDGEAIMKALKKEDFVLGNSEDYRDAMDSMRQLHKHIQESMGKLARLADTRLHKLEQCLQLREFEEECGKIISWLCNQGEDILQRHKAVADNLKAVRAQQKDFEKLYFSAMTHIEKGNDLLEEASMLTQSGNFDEATGYKDLARTLKKHLSDFTGQLEASREKIEGTAKCYHLLDKSYEWALEAMRYVASMKMDSSATADRLAKLLKSLELYLREHPPITDETFKFMTEQADRLHNDRLLEQCNIAKNRCQETFQLLELRQTTLRKAIHQLAAESRGSEDKGKERKGQHPISHPIVPENMCNISKSPYPASPCPATEAEAELVWEPRTSTPSSQISQSSLRRRSYSGKASALMYDDSLSFTPETIPDRYRRETTQSRNDRIQILDVSDRSVASVPKLSTVEEHQCMTTENNVSLTNVDGASAAGLNTSCLGADSSSGPTTLNKHERPHRKMFKRAVSVPSYCHDMFSERDGHYVPSENGAFVESSKANDPLQPIRERRALKSISMITGSTESLPSMPEEDEDGEQGVEHTPQKEWTPVPVNSHLMRQNRTIPTGSVADLRLSEAQVKSRRTLSLIMSEMVQTERDYVQALQFIVENYIPELLRDDVPQALRGKRNIVFGNIEKIYQFHRQYFLRELEACERNPFQVGHYFLLHENQFYLYALYNKNKPKSDSLMVEYGKDFFRRKQSDLGDKMDLSSYLLKPVQRMGKYALLLKQIIKECAETEPEYPELKASEDMVRFQLRHGNDLLAMDSLRDCDVNLQEQGRLIRQGEFLVWQGRRKSLRHIFLFEDLVLFSKTRRGRSGSHETYLYKYSFKMSDIGLTENFGESGYKFEIWFRRRSLGENYVLQAPNSEVKNCWVKEISRLLWKQAIKNRELRLCEMATMGIGNKPCMDIKPSADNINDRFINIAVGSRGARTRNSIAVCSFDHIRNGNKRPHSIISVSSTSSSNSSQSASSYAVFGSNLAFDPLESPRFARRSFAASSNESGICADISLDSMYMLSQRHEGSGALGPRERPRSYHEYVSKSQPPTGVSGGPPLVTDV
ncbi:puratrophin-1-like isoform X2 [Liolophura sinensis]